MMRRYLILIYFLCLASSLFSAQRSLQTLSAYRIAMVQHSDDPPQLKQLWSELESELLLLSRHQVSEFAHFWLLYQARLEEFLFEEERLNRLEEQLKELQGQKYPNLKAIQEQKRSIKAQRKVLQMIPQKIPDYKVPEQLPIELIRENGVLINELEDTQIGINFWLFAEYSALDNRSFFFYLYGYDRMQNQRVELFRGVILWEDRAKMLRKALDTARHLWLGRSWSAIELVDTPSTSSFRLQWQDDTGVPRMPAVEQRHLENLAVDDGRLRAHAVGFQRQEWYLSLQENTRHELSFEAIVSSDDDRFIRTNINGAEVYLDGIYQGQAPLTIQARAGQMVSIVDRAKIRPPLIYEVREVDEEIFLRFSLPIDQQKELILAQKKQFYWWAGSFIVSLILPIVFYNLYLDYAQKANRYYSLGWEYEQQRALRMSRGFGYAGIGTGMLSGGLLGVSIYQLYNYVEISQDPTHRQRNEADDELEESALS
ncbi:PEGA domain-containing protein [Entomospira culicis]|uniref:PEGA domain-containing protein n=1 Tax=Entomospira culicis TaxID=2719989 RepID=A0A968GJH0_9SPIO|nr:PEGA domain-containing protein [Entomospira culicis]NIZ18765.1 PEGA domain-containing protein [Entomospira culicis]NIZ68980.1 PEGA domain-containing protein [Entomospira culicis]WDI37571.1 PEGA domain-containing protein [Entomospira culicis]WDI39199.1 PEGA domain-containing protein [Entomospira culicis]